MKIVFFGTAKFACPVIQEIIKAKHQVLAVVTQPDRPKGRHLSLAEPPIKVLSKRLGLDIFQPTDLDDDEFIKRLKDFNADVFVVVSFGKILKKKILKLPKKMCVNIHASVLPKYRGAAPINWAIANGEKQTGITIIKMDEAMDEGDVILQEKIDISGEDTFITVSNKLSPIGAECLIKALRLLEKAKIKLTPQDNKKATLAPKLRKSDGLINWNDSAADIYNKMRGFIPWPGAFTHLGNKLLKIYKAEVISPVESTLPKPGNILEISKDGILVAAGKGNLLIKELQPEGKRPMSAEEFISGHKLSIGQMLGEKSVA